MPQLGNNLGLIIWSTKDGLVASRWLLRLCLERELWIILFSRYSPLCGTLDNGEDHHKIQRWVADGWLRDRLQGTRRHDGNGRDIHRFREKDILGFIRQHPLEINLGRVDAVWFLDMILLKGREFL